MVQPVLRLWLCQLRLPALSTVAFSLHHLLPLNSSSVRAEETEHQPFPEEVHIPVSSAVAPATCSSGCLLLRCARWHAMVPPCSEPLGILSSSKNSPAALASLCYQSSTGLGGSGPLQGEAATGRHVCLTLLACPVLPSTATNFQPGSGLQKRSEAASYTPQEIQDSVPLQVPVLLSSVPRGALVFVK